MRRLSVTVALAAIASLMACSPKESDFFEPEYTVRSRLVDRTPLVYTDFAPRTTLVGPLNVGEFSFRVNDLEGTDGALASGVDYASIVALSPTGANLPLTRTGDAFRGSLTGVADGPYTVRLNGKDIAGNAATMSYAFVLDRTPPVFALTETPQSGVSVNTPSREITWGGTVTDPNIFVATGSIYRPGTDNMCGTADDVLAPRGSAPGQVSENTFTYPVTGTGGSFRASYTAYNPVLIGGTAQSLAHCLVLRASDKAIDATGASAANSTVFTRGYQVSWDPPPPVTGRITGRVTLDGVGASGVLLNITGQTAGTNAQGVYEFTGVLPGTYAVTLGMRPAGSECSPSAVSVSVTAGGVATADFTCTIPKGSITGQVTANGVPVAGVRISVAEQTFVTDESGRFDVLGLLPGRYVVTIFQLPIGYTCGVNELVVMVVANGTANATFTCSPPTGSLTGVVTQNGAPLSGVRVTLNTGLARTTGADGRYTFETLGSGTYTVTLSQLPPSVGCEPMSVVAEVLPNQTTTRNFACLSLAQFTISMLTSYVHFSGFSRVCAALQTTPARAFAAYTATVSGPGVDGSGVFSGTLDAAGRAALIQQIFAFGLYNWTVTVLGQTATASVNVTGASGTCNSP